MKVYEGMAYGLSQVWVKTEAIVQRNSIEENKNKWQNIWKVCLDLVIDPANNRILDLWSAAVYSNIR